MKTITNSFILTFVALVTLLVCYGCSEVAVEPQVNVNDPGLIVNTKAKASESFSRTVDLTSQTSLKLVGINGSVNIKSAPGINHVSILIEKIVGADTYQDANAHLKNITVEIDERTDQILITTLQPQFSNGRNYVVNYTIIVPSDLSIIVRNVNGYIDSRVSVPLNGTVDMSLINGNIELDIPSGTSADLSASLVNGNISQHNLTLHDKVATSKSLHGTIGEGQGMISLKTTNGNIGVSGY